MKIRAGFVSNSSSSTYIVAFKDDFILGKCPKCGRPYNALPIRTDTTPAKHLKGSVCDIAKCIEEYVAYGDEIVDDQYVDGTGIVLANVERAFLAEEEVLLAKVLDYELRGYTVMYVEIDYYSDEAEALLSSMISEGKLIVVDQETT